MTKEMTFGEFIGKYCAVSKFEFYVRNGAREGCVLDIFELDYSWRNTEPERFEAAKAKYMKYADAILDTVSVRGFDDVLELDGHTAKTFKYVLSTVDEGPIDFGDDKNALMMKAAECREPATVSSADGEILYENPEQRELNNRNRKE